MYSLSKEQKLSNYKEILENKTRKLENLRKEVLNLQKIIKSLEDKEESNLNYSSSSSRFSIPKIGER